MAAYLLDELDEGAIASTARDVVNDQLTYMNEELKTLADHFRATLESETEKHIAAITASTKNLNASPNRSFKDALLNGNPVLPSTDPRILAREGIKAWQILLDFPIDSRTRELSQSNILKKFNEAIVDAGRNTSQHRLRSVEKMINKGVLGEFLTDEGAKWFAQQHNTDNFITALGPLGRGLSIRKWNHPVIAYYVPLHLNTSNPDSITEIEEVNGIQEGELLRIHWAKLPAR